MTNAGKRRALVSPEPPQRSGFRGRTRFEFPGDPCSSPLQAGVETNPLSAGIRHHGRRVRLDTSLADASSPLAE